MNDLWIIVLGAGLHDGLNPCVFMTCAVFISHSRWQSLSSLPVGWLRAIFGLVYGVATLVFNFGPAQIFVLQKDFILTAKVLYFILGIWAFVLGVLFLKDWISLSRGLPVEDPTGKKLKLFPAGRIVVCLTTVVLGLALSILATLWPISQYMLVLGNAALLKGQMVLPLLGGYVVMSMWPLWLVWSFLSIKNLRPSMLKIFCASIFFTASSCVILMFK